MIIWVFYIYPKITMPSLSTKESKRNQYLLEDHSDDDTLQNTTSNLFLKSGKLNKSALIASTLFFFRASIIVIYSI